MPPLLPGEPGDGHGEDDLDADHVGYIPPLPPEDRLWRHPSEVAAGRAAGAPATRTRADRRTASLMLVSGMVGAVLAVGAVSLLGGFDERVVERQVAAQSIDSSAALVDRTAPSVAAVRIERGDDRLDASAVAFRPDGHLVTDARSVADADALDVVLHDGRTLPADVVGVDDVTGIAVLHVDADLDPAALAEETWPPAIGEPTVTIGAASVGGWDAVVSTGVVAAVNRRLDSRDGTTRHGMILVDTPFASGSAGGALVDRTGAVVAIASGGHAVASGTGFGVATPIGLVRHVAEQLVENGQAEHVRLGLHGSDLDIDEAAAMGVAGGAVVKDTEPDGPAHRAGVRSGDVITAVDDEPTPTMSALIACLRRHVPGDEVVLAVRRGSEERTVRVTLAALD